MVDAGGLRCFALSVAPLRRQNSSRPLTSGPRSVGTELRTAGYRTVQCCAGVAKPRVNYLTRKRCFKSEPNMSKDEAERIDVREGIAGHLPDT